MYQNMSFGLMNVGDTFHREMDITFSDEKDHFMVIYIVDTTTFSHNNDQHLKYLEVIFGK